MRLALWFLSLAIACLMVWWLWGGVWEERFSMAGSVRWLEGAGNWAWAAGILLLVVDLVLPVPGTVVISAIGYLYGPVVGGFIATAGLVAAGMAGYGLGRLFGEDTARRLLGHEDFERGGRLFEQGGGWIVALSRALPILPEVVSCTAGLVRMPVRRFVAALVCGSLPMGFLLAGIGSAGHQEPGWVLSLNVAVPALLWFLANRLLRRNNRP